MTLLAIFEALVGANAIWETTVPAGIDNIGRQYDLQTFLPCYQNA